MLNLKLCGPSGFITIILLLLYTLVPEILFNICSRWNCEQEKRLSQDGRQGAKERSAIWFPPPSLLLLILSGPILTIPTTPAAHLLLISCIVLPSGLNCLTNSSSPTPYSVSVCLRWNVGTTFHENFRLGENRKIIFGANYAAIVWDFRLSFLSESI